MRFWGAWLTAFLYVVTASASGAFCRKVYDRAAKEVPQLVSVKGDRNDLSFTLNTWKKAKREEGKGNPDARAEDGADNLANQIASAVNAYARNHLKVDASDAEIQSMHVAVRLLTFETLNNAAFHGNDGDPNKQIRVRVMSDGEKITIAVTDESGKFYDVSKEAEPVIDWDNYLNPETGGGIGKIIRAEAKKDYKISTRSQPVWGPNNNVLGTTVFLEFKPRESLANARAVRAQPQ